MSSNPYLKSALPCQDIHIRDPYASILLFSQCASPLRWYQDPITPPVEVYERPPVFFFFLAVSAKVQNVC